MQKNLLYVHDVYIPVVWGQNHSVFAVSWYNTLGLSVLVFSDGAEIVQHIRHAEAWWFPLFGAPEVPIPVIFLVAWKGREGEQLIT